LGIEVKRWNLFTQMAMSFVEGEHFGLCKGKGIDGIIDILKKTFSKMEKK
jgi:hypothetical protein